PPSPGAGGGRPTARLGKSRHRSSAGTLARRRGRAGAVSARRAPPGRQRGPRPRAGRVAPGLGDWPGRWWVSPRSPYFLSPTGLARGSRLPALHGGAQAEHALLPAPLDRADADAEQVGHLGLRPAVVVDQPDHFALVGRQAGHLFVEGGPSLQLVGGLGPVK